MIDRHDVVVAAARHQVGLLPREDLPMLAAGWLAAGMDTPLLRELAGLSRDDRSTADLWPEVLVELDVDPPVADPRRVLAPWAAHLVLAGERDETWLVGTLLRGIDDHDHGHDPGHDDDLVSLLYGLDACLDVLEQPSGRRVADIAQELADARTEADRIVWLLARLDPDEEPPQLRREQVAVDAAVRALRDDLRRVTRRRWSLDRDDQGGLVLSSPDRSDSLAPGRWVDGDALPPEVRYEEIAEGFLGEAVDAVVEPVLDMLTDWGRQVRCAEHRTPLTTCSGLWVCDSDPGHDLAEVGGLRRRDAEIARID